MADENTQAIEPAQGALPLPETAADTAETPAAEVEATEQPAADSSTAKPKGVAVRIDELTRNWRSTERERDYWREMAMRQKPAEPDKPADIPPVTLPTLESVGYDESKYQAALLSYSKAEAVKAAREVMAETKREEAEQARKATWQERQAKFMAKTADYAEKVLDPSAPFSATMSEHIMDSDMGPELAYYLANNREIAAKIAQLPERRAAAELGRIEGQLSQQKAAATRPAPAKPAVSQAPPPPATLETADAAPLPVKPTEAESDKAYSDAEWYKAREKQLARKKR